MGEKTFAEKLSANNDTQYGFEPIKDEELFKLDLCSLTLAEVNPFHPKEEQLAQQLAKFILDNTTWKANNLINDEISRLGDYDLEIFPIVIPNFTAFGQPERRTLNRAKNILDVQHCRDNTSPTAEVSMEYTEEWYPGAGYTNFLPKFKQFEINYPITPDSPGDAPATTTFIGTPWFDYKTKSDLIDMSETDIYK